MDTERWWPPFVDAVAVVWVALFGVDIAARYGVIALSSALRLTARGLLRALLLVFLVDVVLLYRLSDDDPRSFVRSNWFSILTVVPWFRPVRLLRAGRAVRAVRVLRVRAAAIRVREAIPRDLPKIVGVT